MFAGPLEGLRVLDAGNMIAGPMTASFLADYGADVIRIEHPKIGDPLRDWEPKRAGVSLWWKVLNRNKRLITLDLSQERGQDLFIRLVRSSDIVIENFRAGKMERWGLGYPALSEANPGVVFVRISGYGQTGPYRHRPGYGTVAEAMSGIPSFTGTPDGAPTLPGFPLADAVAAVVASLGAVSAVYCRDHSCDGSGQEIDLGLYEALFRLVDSQVIGYDQLGRIKQRVGNRLEEDAPRNIYRTRDGAWIAVSASSNRTWARLAEALGRPELIEDPRFAAASDRVANVEALDSILADWFNRQTRDEAMRELVRRDVVAGPIFNIMDIFDDEHYQARGNIISVPDPDFGVVRMQSPVPRFSRTPPKVRFPGLAPGHHNEDVYQKHLGLTSAELLDLRKVGVI